MGLVRVYHAIRNSFTGWLQATGLIIFFAVLCAIFLIHNKQTTDELRFTASNSPREIKISERPGEIVNATDGKHIWGIRQRIESTPIGRGVINGVQFLKDVTQMTSAHDKATVTTLAPVLPTDGAAPPHIFASMPFGPGEALDLDGNPLRWYLPDNLLAGYSIPRVWRYSPPRQEATPEKPQRPAIRRGNASHYRELVENFANRYGLNADLVMAIIHSESDFSPTIVSNKSAMGLMQLLPSTASDEVHRFLYGRRGQVGFDDLSVPETNIKYGTAYLHILFNRYFANVQNRDVREICAIASYNLGPNRFIRLYGPTPEAAIANINTMSPEEFYADLPNRLPARETRFFVEKVRRMKNHYSSIQ